MTTSEPQAGRRDDDTRDHRSIGQRIREAVLGDDDPRRDGPETRYADPARDATGTVHDDPAAYDDPATRTDTGASFPESGRAAAGDRDGAPGDLDRGAGVRDDTVRGDGLRGDDTLRGDDVRGDGLRDDTVRGDVRGDSGHEYAGYEQAMREHVEGGAVPDPVRDDVAQDGTRRDVTDRTAADGSGSGSGSGGMATGARDDRDAVTTSYDPDRDSDYDPQAAGTALGDPPARSTSDAGGREYDTRDYEPATDTGYVGEGRADADRVPDRTIGDRGADRDDSGRSGGGAAAGAAAGAAVAAATHHDDDRRADRTGFSEVDDTSAVEPDNSRAAAMAAGGRDEADRADAVADEAGGSATSATSDGSADRERLVPAARAQKYSSRWDALKGDFVDEPQRAVVQADQLVGELLDEIQKVFTDQRRELDKGFDHDKASTEDLRLALRRYRSFFDRLLSI
jgi:hypothetical protein